MRDQPSNSQPPNDDGQAPVEVLAEQYLQRRANGERVTIDDYAGEYPDLADDIREVFPALEALKTLSADWKRNVADRVLSGPELPFQLGDFRLEQEIGRGGMGIVYQAEHTSLRRSVAVKLLRPSSLNSAKDIQRFHREAKSAARLHHTNIVPVFDFGAAEGFHYIAMQLIQGTGLDAVVSSLRVTQTQKTQQVDSTESDSAESNCTEPNRVESNRIDSKSAASHTHESNPVAMHGYGSPDFWQQVASIGIQAGNALGYAHSQGIVHRDIKPGNLLMDDTGIVWVADFGLARQDQSDETTLSGVLSGTLRYLAPEHFHGQCDARADQYGLGLSLYELVTLQPVVGDSGSHAETMRRIAESQITPPRQLNPDIPKDLETIILKAISAIPDQRFPTCGALADDLQRFVDGRPITARPVTRIERLWRWTKRYPALATSLVTSAALLVMVAVVAMLGYRAEHKQRQRAESTSEYALQALDTVFDGYSPTQSSSALGNGLVLPAPVLSRESAQMLERLLPIFDRLAAMDGQSSDVRFRAITARKRVGNIQQQLGNFSEAIESYRLATDGYQKLAEGGQTKTTLQIADIFNDIGTCQLMSGQTNESKASHQTALEQLQSLEPNGGHEVVFQLARTHFLLTRWLRPGESPTAVMRMPPSHSRRPGSDRPDHTDPRNRPRRGGPRDDRRGPPGPRQTRPDDREHLEAAIRLLESLGDEHAQSPRCRHLLATTLRGLVPDHFSGKTDYEIAAETRALKILEDLSEEYPDVSQYRQSYVEALAAVAINAFESFNHDDCLTIESRLRKAVKSGAELVAQHPYVQEYTVTLIHANNKLGNVLEHRGHDTPSPDSGKLFADALAAYRSAAKLQQSLVKRFPNATAYDAWLKEFQQAAARVTANIAE